MSDITLTDLARILRECAGEGEETGGESDFADAPFEELGYDSLAILETAGRLKLEYGVELTDEEVVGAGTPRELLDLARERIAASAT